MEAEELVMPKEGTYARPATVTQVDRGAGQNDVGIVAWLLTLKTPECPQGRQVGFRHALDMPPALEGDMLQVVTTTHDGLLCSLLAVFEDL